MDSVVSNPKIMHTVYIPHKTQSIVLVDDNLFVRPGKPGHMEVQWIQWFQTRKSCILYTFHMKTQSIVVVDDNLLVRPGKPGHMEVQWIQWFQTRKSCILFTFHLKPKAVCWLMTIYWCVLEIVAIWKFSGFSGFKPENHVYCIRST